MLLDISAKKIKIKISCLKDFVVYLIVLVLFYIIRTLPYENRLKFSAKIIDMFEPALKIKERSLQNLAEIFPSMELSERIDIANRVSKNIGYHIADFLSHSELTYKIQEVRMLGPGITEIEQALKEGRPIIFASGHFGCYEALRLKALLLGYNIGGLYKPFRNKSFNRLYVDIILSGGGSLFEKSHRGYVQMVKHLRAGGCVAILHDQHISKGLPVKFFEKTALTGNLAAKLALANNALLVPAYGFRRELMNFEFIIEKPIKHTNIFDMTQEITKSLESVVATNKGQWIWNHRRW